MGRKQASSKRALSQQAASQLQVKKVKAFGTRWEVWNGDAMKTKYGVTKESMILYTSMGKQKKTPHDEKRIVYVSSALYQQWADEVECSDFMCSYGYEVKRFRRYAERHASVQADQKLLQRPTIRVRHDHWHFGA